MTHPEQEGKPGRWDPPLLPHFKGARLPEMRETTKVTWLEGPARAFKGHHTWLSSQVLPNILEISGLPKSSLFPQFQILNSHNTALWWSSMHTWRSYLLLKSRSVLTNTDYYGNKSYNTDSIIHVLNVHYIRRSDQNIRGNKTGNPCPPKPYVPVLINKARKSVAQYTGR